MKKLLIRVRKMNKSPKVVVIIAFICIIVLCLFYIYPRSINITYSAIEYQAGNIQMEKPVKINIDGFYYNKILSKDTFGGSITISGKKLKIEKLEVNTNGQLLYGINDKGDVVSYGTVCANNEMSSLTICILKNGGWSSKDGLMLSAPSKGRADALNISNNLIGSFILNKLK